MAILNSSSSHEIRAQALFEYLRNKFPKVTLELAASAVRGLEIQVDEDRKAFAKRLRQVLGQKGVKIKHTASLEAAARVLGGTSWHASRQGDLFHTLAVLSPDDSEEHRVASWVGAGHLMVEMCKAWLNAHPSIRALQVQCRPQSLSILGSRMVKAYSAEGSDYMPITVVSPIDGVQRVGTDWLKGFGSALEYLRRNVEEAGFAVLDGFSAARYSEPPESWTRVLPGSVTEDARSTELVVVRNDNPLMRGGYEIARGDELTCWSQFDQATKDASTGARVAVEDDGAWVVGEARFEWQLMTLRPGEFYPGIVMQALSHERSARLLHRYKLAKRILQGQPLVQRSEVKPIGAFSETPESYRVNRNRIVQSLSDVGLTWDAFCAEAGEAGRSLTAELPVGLVISLLMRLKPEDPNVLFARPSREQLVWLGHDHIVRAMLPRVNHVRYHIGSDVSPQLNEGIVDAIQNLSASIAMRQGIVRMEDPLPDLVYSSDGDDLSNALENLGLTAYVGIMPHLAKIPNEMEFLPDSVPWALGYSLFVDIDLSFMPARATGT